jgi:tRNA-dihydrouridine synthase
MVGRGIFKNPWMFNPTGEEPSLTDKINLLKTHVKLYEKTWGLKKSINPLKRFFKIYIHGFKGASTLRAQLMEAKDYGHIYEALSLFLSGQGNLPGTKH